jgi:hypothetical protein
MPAIMIVGTPPPYARVYSGDPCTVHLPKPLFLGPRHDYKFIIDEHGILSAVCQVDYCPSRLIAAEIIAVLNEAQ